VLIARPPPPPPPPPLPPLPDEIISTAFRVGFGVATLPRTVLSLSPHQAGRRRRTAPPSSGLGYCFFGSNRLVGCYIALVGRQCATPSDRVMTFASVCTRKTIRLRTEYYHRADTSLTITIVLRLPHFGPRLGASQWRD